MVMLREGPPEKDEDDPEPEPDIVPIGGRDQQCHDSHDREDELFQFTALSWQRNAAILCPGREDS
jgi:hypothetical protein